MTYFGQCAKCTLPVESPQTPAYQVIGFEVPREQGGTNHVRNRVRTPGMVWHETCLPKERENADQQTLL